MATWSGIRKKLETEYLAQSLQGHIQYYATSYSRSHDHEGRAAIRYDGKEIIKGCYWNNWAKADMFPQDEKYEKRMKVENAYMDDTAIKILVGPSAPPIIETSLLLFSFISVHPRKYRVVKLFLIAIFLPFGQEASLVILFNN